VGSLSKISFGTSPGGENNKDWHLPALPPIKGDIFLHRVPQPKVTNEGMAHKKVALIDRFRLGPGIGEYICHNKYIELLTYSNNSIQYIWRSRYF